MKFSKLFGRRRAPVYMEPDPLTARRVSSPDVHQLKSNRRRHGAGRKAMRREGTLMSLTTIPPSGRVIADEEHPPCVICRAVDFPSLLDWRPGNPRPWVELSHTITQSWFGSVTANKPGDADSATASSVSAATEDAPCPYCTFFRLMIGQLPDKSGKFTPYLRIRQAFEKLGVKEKAELGKAVLVEVTTKDKDLPWGYILKAADDPSTHEGPLSVRTYLGRKAVLEGRVVPQFLDPLLPKTWIEFCRTHHEDTCEPIATTVAIPNLRLIDCDTRRIILASDLQESPVDRYAALSYSRSQDEETREVHHAVTGQLGEQLPQLFVDAITMTKNLGLRYLWIDKCCSPEDSGSQPLPPHLIGDVFHQAAVTLIPATDGDSAGIPGVSSPREEHLSLVTDAGLFTTSLLRPDLEVASCSWASQARTFQEGLFSRRRLVFTSSQCYFQCCHLHCHESIGVSLHLAPGLNLGRVFATDGGGTTPGQLKDQIQAYIPRLSAHPEERLSGFQSVLKKYQQMENSVDELLGVPLFHVDDFNTGTFVTQTDRLAIGLGWMPAGEAPAPGIVEPYYYHEDESGKGLPSWSWLSWRVRPDCESVNQAFQFSMVGENSPIVAPGVSAPPKMEISVGFEDGKLMSWEIDGDLAVKKKRATATGRISYLRVLTWCFNLPIRELPAGETASHALDCNLPKTVRQRVLTWYKDALPGYQAAPPTPIADAHTTKSLPDPKSIDVSSVNCPDGSQGDLEAEQISDQIPRVIGVILSGQGWQDSTIDPTSTAAATTTTTTNTTSPSSSLNNSRTTEAGTASSPAFTILICVTLNTDDSASESSIPKLRRLGAIRLPCDGFAAVNQHDAILRGVEMDAGEKKALKISLREVDLW